MIEEASKANPLKLQEAFQQPHFYTDKILLITATEQTSGIGLEKRTWTSPPGNIFATFVFPWPDALQLLLPFVSQVTNLAVCQTVKDFGLQPEFKWINDMLLGGGKGAGILCHYKGTPGLYKDREDLSRAKYSPLMVGIGLNVNMAEEVATQGYKDTIDRMQIPFSSMRIVAGKEFDIEKVLAVLQVKLVSTLKTLLKTTSFTEFFEEITPMLAYVNQPVEFSEDDSQEPSVYIFLGINPSGHARLKHPKTSEVKECFTGRLRLYIKK